MSEKIDMQDLRKILNYIIESEKTHWEESDYPDDHIYQIAVNMSNKIHPL